MGTIKITITTTTRSTFPITITISITTTILLTIATTPTIMKRVYSTAHALYVLHVLSKPSSTASSTRSS